MPAVKVHADQNNPPLQATMRRATAHDIPGIARIHIEGFAGYRSTLLGERFVAEVVSWFLAQPFSIVLVAEAGDRLAGFVFGAPVGYVGQLNRSVFPAAAMAILIRPWLLLRPVILQGIIGKLRQVAKARPQQSSLVEEPAFSLVGIGVDSQFRGKGIAGILISCFEEEVAVRGFRRIRLSVKKDNIAALRAYEKAGWIRCTEEAADLYTYRKQVERCGF